MTTPRYADGEELRHVPQLHRLIRWIDETLRREGLAAASVLFEGLDVPSDVRERAHSFATSACHWLDRTAELAHTRRAGLTPLADIAAMQQAFSCATDALRSQDEEKFRRKATPDNFDRSRSEQMYGALLVAGCKIRELVDLAASVDPDLRMRLNERNYPPIAVFDDSGQRMLMGSTSTVTSTP